VRFLADMGVSITTVHALRDAAHDAVHLREDGPIWLPDPDIVAKAVREHRVVLTFDLDFGDIMTVAEPVPGSPVILDGARDVSDGETDRLNHGGRRSCIHAR